MIDVKINDPQGKFKFRVGIILKHNDKVLIVRMHNNPFLCLPGGHVELGEDTEKAVLRECKEELEIDAEIKRLIAIHENFFQESSDNRIFHEIAFYYELTPKDVTKINTENFTFYENDKGSIIKHDFYWVNENELKDSYFKPEIIKSLIFDNKPLQHIITKD